MSKEGNNNIEIMQNKIKNHSNIIVLIKTNENKIFGWYRSIKIEYNGKSKKDNKSFLFSIDLNERFYIKQDKYAIYDYCDYGISFGDSDLVLFDYFNYNECYSFFGSEDSHYENNGITRDEFCGGIKRSIYENDFTPIEIDICEIIEN